MGCGQSAAAKAHPPNPAFQQPHKKKKKAHKKKAEEAPEPLEEVAKEEETVEAETNEDGGESGSEQMHILIAGPPASGKGTQCENIVERFGVVHVSTGDALREQVNAGTELGQQADECMKNGQLVPDELIIDIVKDRLAQEDCQSKGWLLDGFPRTGAQAEALKEAGIVATHFVLLEVPDEILVERCTGRRSDPVTGKIYHLTFNPPPDDPEVLERLVHRKDDTAEAMGKRINMYHENVEAVIPFYENIMHKFDGQKDKQSIGANITAWLAGEEGDDDAGEEDADAAVEEEEDGEEDGEDAAAEEEEEEDAGTEEKDDEEGGKGGDD